MRTLATGIVAISLVVLTFFGITSGVNLAVEWQNHTGPFTPPAPCGAWDDAHMCVWHYGDPPLPTPERSPDVCKNVADPTTGKSEEVCLWYPG